MTSDVRLFKALERDDTLSIRVTREIERLIVDRHLKLGERLLSERELADRFGVSRTVIREAVRSLAAKGLLEVRTGHGTYVQDGAANAAEALGRLLRLTGVDLPSQARAVYEVRRPLEIAIAALAAERATAEDLLALKGWVDAIFDPEIDDAAFVEADVRFHTALADATHNRLFTALLHSVSDLMKALRELGGMVEGSRQEARRHHKQIYERVAAHDIEGARKVMSGHMASSERILDRAIARLGRHQ